MKTIYSFLLIVFFNLRVFSQVGINTETPHPSSTLEIYSNVMGISFPNLHLGSRLDNSLIINPKESLLIYNTNENIIGKKGYYFWNGTKWDYFVSDTNVDNLKNHTRYYSAISQNKYTFLKSSNEFYGDTNHAIGENITSNPTWTVITDLTKNITIDRANNQLFITVSGMVHANNTNVSGRAVTSFGFFIDDKLVDIKPISIDFDQACTYRGFTIYAVASNLSTGSHVLKFAIRNRSTTSTENGLSITFGGKNPSSSCTNISDDEAKISGTIFINQPYEF